MTDREEQLTDALVEIKQWAEAYPVTVFTPLHPSDFGRAALALKAIGIDMGALHAEWARHILKGVGEICEKALR